MPFNIDPDLPVPLGTQLRGVIEYGIVCGQLAPGLRLPPVRSMASQLGIAPMTVSQVYKELKAVGLLETKPGHGTFVSTTVLTQARPQMLELQPRIDALLDEADAAGLERRRPGRAGQCPDQPPQPMAPRPAPGLRRPVRGGDPRLWRRHPVRICRRATASRPRP